MNSSSSKISSTKPSSQASLISPVLGFLARRRSPPKTWSWLSVVLVIVASMAIQHTDARRIYSSKRQMDPFNQLGCSSEPSLRIIKYLDRVCEDCFMLYRDPDLYQMCRSDCYSSDYFVGCMDVTMVSKPTRVRAARFVNLINSYGF